MGIAIFLISLWKITKCLLVIPAIPPFFHGWITSSDLSMTSTSTLKDLTVAVASHQMLVCWNGGTPKWMYIRKILEHPIKTKWFEDFEQYIAENPINPISHGLYWKILWNYRWFHHVKWCENPPTGGVSEAPRCFFVFSLGNATRGGLEMGRLLGYAEIKTESGS